MRIAKVVGNVVSTIKDDGYNGYKLMLVQYLEPDGTPTGPRLIAFDCADAGVGDIVLVNNDGGAAQMIMGDTKLIASVTICGVIDSYSWQGQTVHCH